MRTILIGVLGPGEGAGQKEMDDAALIGELVAKAGWGVLTGGRVAGVMGAAAKGARAAGGLTVGLLPTPDTLGASPAVDVVLATGLGEARNAVIALSANACVVCGMNSCAASSRPASANSRLACPRHSLTRGRCSSGTAMFSHCSRCPSASRR